MKKPGVIQEAIVEVAGRIYRMDIELSEEGCIIQQLAAHKLRYA